jgi:1-acyl-sn-glycerol-3-phosphate acyltransferase
VHPLVAIGIVVGALAVIVGLILYATRRRTTSGREGPSTNSLRRRVWVATRLTKQLMRFCIRVLRLYIVETFGRHHIPQRGAAVIAARHISNLDPVLVLGTLRRRRNIAFISMAELFRGLFGRLMRWHGHIPVDRKDTDSGRAAIEQGRVVLSRDGLVGIFIEGRRSTTGNLLTPKPGIGWLVDTAPTNTTAIPASVPVIPCWIDGTQRALPLNGKPRLRQRLVARYGEPLYKGADEPAQAFANRVMAAIAELGGVPAPAAA